MFKMINRFFKGSKIIQIVQYERTDKFERTSRNGRVLEIKNMTKRG